MEDLQEDFFNALLNTDRIKSKEVINKALETRTVIQITDEIIRPILEEMGKGWEDGSIALSQVYMSGKICEEIIKYLFKNQEQKIINTYPIAIVALEDFHVLGKRIVYTVLKANGYDIKDYGSLTVDELIKRVNQEGIKLLLISVLMFSSALRVKEVTKAFLNQGIRVIVGGAPFRFDQELWKSVGADAMGFNAQDAITFIEEYKGDLL